MFHPLPHKQDFNGKSSQEMDDQREIAAAESGHKPQHHQQLSGRAKILHGAAAVLLVGGPLLAVAAFAAVSSVLLLLVAAPLLLLFSPVLLPAAFVVGSTMGGLGAGAAAAVGGVWTLKRAVRYVHDVVGSYRRDSVLDMLTMSRDRRSQGKRVDFGARAYDNINYVVLPAETKTKMDEGRD